MLPQRFDQARPFATLGVILLVWLFVPLVLKTFARATFFEIQAPLQVADSFVEDLGTFWAGPYVAMYLGAFGADVVKVESIQRPDGFRFSPSATRRDWTDETLQRIREFYREFTEAGETFFSRSAWVLSAE